VGDEGGGAGLVDRLVEARLLSVTEGPSGGTQGEGSHEAIDHAIAAREAGADAILLMPPHHWLRFGRSASTAVGFMEDVATDGGVSIIVHQYPAWTKAGYTLAEMKEMVKIIMMVIIG
jgi:4-hydroxy-tetrahydrodipicolinate synthase